MTASDFGTGQCLCGAIRYRLGAPPLTVYACHCTDCQRRTGTAFALSVVVRRAALDILQGEPADFSATLPDGRDKTGLMCARCGTRLWDTPGRAPDLAILLPGTLESAAEVRPVAHLWTRSAQPWFVLPAGTKRYATQPEDWSELIELWQQAGCSPASGALRPQPLIAVKDVQASSRWYQALLDCESGHGGPNYERLVRAGELLLQLHAWHVEGDEHEYLGDPGTVAGNGVLLWFEVGDFDAAVARAHALNAQVLEDVKVNPNAGHREIWLRDPDGYVVVLASPA